MALVRGYVMARHQLALVKKETKKNDCATVMMLPKLNNTWTESHKREVFTYISKKKPLIRIYICAVFIRAFPKLHSLK